MNKRTEVAIYLWIPLFRRLHWMVPYHLTQGAAQV